jgi:hypothetical protein
MGDRALQNNITGSFHTAVGVGALQNCIALPDFAGNTAVGSEALFADTTGNFNTAVGDNALKLNTTGNANTAIGLEALVFNTVGIQNTAAGADALSNNTNGVNNTATGVDALFSNTTGNSNTGIGFSALLFNTTGSGNTAIGMATLVNSNGNNNTALGNGAGNFVVTANNVICIGPSVPGADVSNTCFIGNIRGVTTQNADAVPVLIDSAGQLGTVSSSRRFKKEIKPMDQTSEVILSLKPVTFQYKSDKTDTPQFGLIAEEVADVNPDLVVRDNKGEIYTVRYEAVNAMLLNEFLKEHKGFVEEQRKVEKLEATIARQHKDFEAAVAELKWQVQKVSAQLEASKAAWRVAESNY